VLGRSGDGGGEATTDVDGSFRLEDLAPGPHEVVVACPDEAPSPARVRVEVEAGRERPGVELTAPPCVTALH
jgi:hypothetical protein